MKIPMLLLLALLAIPSLASAAIVNCSSIGNLSELTSGQYSGVGSGCQDQDKLYTNFVYNPTGGVIPGDVDVDISFGTLGPLDVHVVALQAGGTGWQSQFILSYTLQVTDPLRYINLIQLDATFLGATLGDVSQTNTPAGSVDPLVVTNLSGNAQTAHFAQLLDVVVTGSPGANSSIQQFSSIYTQSSPVPEPATYAMLGAGLVGLAFYRRKHT